MGVPGNPFGLTTTFTMRDFYAMLAAFPSAGTF
jgi:hypothetical protein